MKTVAQAKAELAALLTKHVADPAVRREMSSKTAAYVAAVVREERSQRRNPTLSRVFADSLFGQIFGR